MRRPIPKTQQAQTNTSFCGQATTGVSFAKDCVLALFGSFKPFFALNEVLFVFLRTYLVFDETSLFSLGSQ